MPVCGPAQAEWRSRYLTSARRMISAGFTPLAAARLSRRARMSAGSRTEVVGAFPPGDRRSSWRRRSWEQYPRADRFTGVADLSVVADSGQRSQRFQSKTSPIVCAVAARLSHVSSCSRSSQLCTRSRTASGTSIPRARSTVRTPTASPAPGSTLQHQLQRSPERETAPLRSG